MAFLGELRWFPYMFIPQGWLPCNGQIVAITDYQELFSLYGTTYGGDGQSTFGIPDLRGRAVVGTNGADLQLGTAGGQEAVTLDAANLPIHEHAVSVSVAAGTTDQPAGALIAADSADTPFIPGAAPPQPVALAGSTIASAGGGAAHSNMQPWLALQPCVCVSGPYPTPA